MKILNNSLGKLISRKDAFADDPGPEESLFLAQQRNEIITSKGDNSKLNKTYSVKFMNYVEPYTIKGVRYTLFYTEVDHNLIVGDKVFIVGGNYDSDKIIQTNKFNKLADGYKVLYVDKTIVVLDIEYVGDLPWNENDDDDFIKIFVASTQQEFEYLIQQSSARDSYQYLSNKFAQKNSHSNNTFLYINGTFSLTGYNWGILGFTSSGNSYLTYSNSFLLYDQFGTGQSVTGYLKDITSDILSGSYSQYLSTNLHPKALTSGFESKGYLLASKREVKITSISSSTTTIVVITTDNPHFITTPTSLTLKNVTGSGFSYYNNAAFNFVPLSTNVLISVIIGNNPVNATGYIEKPIITSKDESIYNNGKIKIFGSDFEKSDIMFKSGYVYDFDGTAWIKDITYLRPYITTANFRLGRFKSGKFAQGLLGTHLDQINYDGSDVQFTLGSVLNANWSAGNLGSFVANNISYFTTFDQYGLPNIKVNSRNNGGFSYNYIQDTIMNQSVISNGNFNNNILGSSASSNIVEDFLKSSNSTYSVTTLNGRFENTKLTNSNIKNSTLVSSNIFSSLVQNSKSVNSDFESSVFSKSKFTSDKIIKILGYEERFLNWWDADKWQSFKLYKFYFDKKYIDRLVNFQNFYLDGLTITKPDTDVLNFFDVKFSLDSYKDSYDTETQKKFRRVISQISYAGDNNLTVFNNGTNYLTQSTDYYGLASLDIFVSATPSLNIEDFNTKKVTEYYGNYKFDLQPLSNAGSWESQQSVIGLDYTSGSFTFSATPSMLNIYSYLNTQNVGTWTYSGYILEASGSYLYNTISVDDSVDNILFSVTSYRNSRQVISGAFNDLSITDAYIIDSDFKSGLFKDSTWVSGNHHNYNQDHNILMNANSDKFIGKIDLSGTPKLNLNIGLNNRKRLIKKDEIVFLNGIYYDTNVVGGDKLVKLPDTYKVSSFNDPSIDLVDTLNGTSSVLYFVPDSGFSTVLTTKLAQHAYNYIHPVKFENSIIQSGIFRRTYFVNCVLDNFNLNTLDKDPKNFTNWRNLLISENIFIDNSNSVKSAVVANSSFVSGSDRWLGGIFYKSIWNVESFTYSISLGMTPSDIYSTQVNKFESGMVKNSRWVNGIFGNGLFYKNNSNAPFTSSVYDDSQSYFWINRNVSNEGKTRYAWLGGTFEKGQFELSNFEGGTLKLADFYNSTMFDGVSKGTNFGRKNLKFTLTKVLSGTFSEANVVSAEFRTANPDGSYNGAKKIDWISGVFNSGEFGVKVDSASYSENGFNYGFNATWYDGTFNNGTFNDIAVWENGKFNNGKFVSYWGYPQVVAASYSSAGSASFAWQNGEFNGGQFGNGSTGSNSTWFKGEFNGGIFKGRYWHDGIFTRGFFYGSGLTATSLNKVPQFISDFSDNFYGLWNSGWVNEVKDNFIKDKRIFTKIEREFTKKKKNLNTEFKNVLWRGGTFSHNNAQMTESVWLGGVFEKGKFYKSSFNPYANYVVNGFFNDQLNNYEITTSDYIEDLPVYNNIVTEETARFQTDTAKKLVFTGTSSIANLYQTAGLIPGQLYNLKVLMLENYNTEIRFGGSPKTLRNRNFTEDGYWVLAATSSSGGSMPITFILATGSPGYVQYEDGYIADTIAYLIYPNAFEVGKDYNVRFYTYGQTSMVTPFVGCGDSTQISYDSGTLLTDFTLYSNYTYSVPTVSGNFYYTNFTAEFSDLVIECRANDPTTSFKMTSFIVTGNDKILTTSDITSRKMLSYSFNATDPDFAIEFIPKHTAASTAPPTIDFATSSVFSIELIKGSSGFNLSDNCRWDGGTFEDSEFYISKWNSGKWISGTAIGMIWKNGVANYMNAYNVYWQGGVWRNGNWNGSPFTYENLNPNGCSHSYSLETSSGLESPWDGLDLTTGTPQGLGAYSFLFYGSSGFKFMAQDGSNPGIVLSNNYYQDYALDPNNTGNFVNTYGLPFVKSQGVDYTPNTNYRVSITIGTVSIPNYVDSDSVSIIFSLGKPSQENVSYGQSFGPYEGSIYPSAIELAGANFISNLYLLKNLDGHTGSIVPDLQFSGIDGYQATNGGNITETINTGSDGKFYFHFNAYGVKELYVDSITIEQENCITRPEVNDGYVSDILTNVALYRQSIEDPSYQEVFINDAFQNLIDVNFPNVNGYPLFTYGSVTYSIYSTTNRQSRNWVPSNSYPNLSLINCSTIPETKAYIGSHNGQTNGFNYRVSNTWVNNNTQYYTLNSKPLYILNTLNQTDLFTQSGGYEVKINYFLQYGTIGESYVENTGAEEPQSYLQSGRYGSKNVQGKIRITVNGIPSVITQIIPAYPVGCNGVKWFGTSGLKTFTSTFEREFASSQASQYKKIKIELLANNAYGKFVTLFITGVEIKAKTIDYDKVYNNATYSMFDSSPSYSDNLLLPQIELIGGYRQGSLISTRFGNGIFTSGTASAFSSIWENGVWNEGLRFDKWVYAFSDLAQFTGSSKPLAFAGSLDIRSTRSGTIASDADRNLTKIVPSGNNWIIALNRLTSVIDYERISVDQTTTTLPYHFKVGDKVSVGNIVARDQNDKRRVLRDPFTVVRVLDDIIYLQITLNFSIRRLEKDSDLHLIYVSKNIWTNGAFLNGTFRGLWTNGLFKGRPQITLMLDSQWADGRFEGGHFKGLQASTYEDLNRDKDSLTTYHSGLVQNFIFKDVDKYTDGNLHKYDSWIDVNYTTYSTVTVGKDTITYDEGGLITASISYGELSKTNHFSLPTFDVLSSTSYIRDNGTSNIKEYSLGSKFVEYTNYFDDIGEFNQYYNTNNVVGRSKFLNDGFTWSGNSQIKFPPLSYPGTYSYLANTNDSNENQLELLTNLGAGVLSNPGFWTTGLLNNSLTDEHIKRRYSYISYDVILNHIPGIQDSNELQYYRAKPLTYQGKEYDDSGSYYFSGPFGSGYLWYGQVTLQLTVDKGNSVLPKGYLNTLNRPTLNVKEYFYNKRGLNLVHNHIFSGTTPSNIKISNLKMVETDAIPFFLLGTESRINTSVQAPWSSSAPNIDYTNNEFSLIDSIQVSESVFETLEGSENNLTSDGVSTGTEYTSYTNASGQTFNVNNNNV